MGKEIVQRIDALLRERNEKRLALAEQCGFSLQSISDWSNRGSVPSADKAVAIADYLGVSIEWLLTGKEKEGLTEKEREMIRRYRILSDKERKAVDNLIETLISDVSNDSPKIETLPEIIEPEPEPQQEQQPEQERKQEKKPEIEYIDVGEIIMIPCLGITAAGSPTEIFNEPSEYIPFPLSFLPGGKPEEYFFVNIRGTSMTDADIKDGDNVLIRFCPEPQVGKIMLVRHEGESTLKKIEIDKDGRFILCWEDGSGRTQPIGPDWNVIGIHCRTVRGWKQ